MNEPIHIELTISNVGSTKWLHQNVRDIGVVKVGIHLYDSNRKMMNHDFFRATFEGDVLPGHRFTETISVTLPEKGAYYLEIDLVSELICWFGWFGSEPKSVRVAVE